MAEVRYNKKCKIPEIIVISELSKKKCTLKFSQLSAEASMKQAIHKRQLKGVFVKIALFIDTIGNGRLRIVDIHIF